MADTTPIALCHRCGQVAYRDDVRGRPICQHCDPTLTYFCPRDVDTEGEAPTTEQLAERVKAAWNELGRFGEYYRERGGGAVVRIVGAPLRQSDLEQCVYYATCSGSETNVPGFVMTRTAFEKRFEHWYPEDDQRPITPDDCAAFGVPLVMSHLQSELLDGRSAPDAHAAAVAMVLRNTLYASEDERLELAQELERAAGKKWGDDG